MTSTADARTKAATFAAFAERHRENSVRLLRNTPVQPPGFGLPREMAPMSPRAALAHLTSNPKGGDPALLRSSRRSALCALMHPAPADALKQLSDQSQPLLQDVWSPCVWPHPRASSDKERDGIEPSAQTRKHETIAVFDPDTFTTTVTTTVTVEGASDKVWNQLVLGSDPAYWSKASPKYFLDSTPEPGQEKRAVGWAGRLHEVFQWQWNPDSAARYENILQIDFSALDAKRAAAVSIPAATSVHIDYSLVNCISTNLWAVSQSGGLDIDDGSVDLTRDLQAQTIKIEAVKIIRYTQPQIAPDGFVMLLNYLTPAVLAQWLDEAVFQGVVNATQPTKANDGAPKGRPNPPSGAPESTDLPAVTVRL